MTCLLFSRWVNAVSHTLSNSFASLKTNVSVSTAVAANKILNKRCRYDSVARASVLLVLRTERLCRARFGRTRSWANRTVDGFACATSIQAMCGIFNGMDMYLSWGGMNGRLGESIAGTRTARIATSSGWAMPTAQARSLESRKGTMCGGIRR